MNKETSLFCFSVVVVLLSFIFMFITINFARKSQTADGTSGFLVVTVIALAMLSIFCGNVFSYLIK